MLNFLIISLTIWRLCALMLYDDLPFDLMAKFRDKIGVTYNPYPPHEAIAFNPLAALFICIYCLSIWVALPFALYFYRGEWLLYWFALSGAAIGLDKAIRG